MIRISQSARFTGWTIAAAALVSIVGLVAISRADRQAAAGATFLAAGHTISGNVTDDAGKPAVNVSVRLLQKISPKKGPIARPPGGDSVIGTPAPEQLQKSASGQERTVKEMKTDAAGHFAFTEVVPGKYSVAAGLGKAMVREDVEVTTSDPAALALKLNPQ